MGIVVVTARIISVRLCSFYIAKILLLQLKHDMLHIKSI